MHNKTRVAVALGCVAPFFLVDVLGAQPLQIQIASQPIDRALGEFVQQSGLQVLFPADESTKLVVTPQIIGNLTPDAALSLLLSNSGLSYEFVNPQTVAIRLSPHKVLKVARSDEGSAPGVLRDSDVDKPALTGNDRGIPEVLIKGVRSLNADIERTEDGILPYVVLNRQTIERSTASSVEDLLKSTLTMNYVAVSNDRRAENGSSRSTVALRGLSSQQTLILIDGRRASLGGQFGDTLQPDLNSIPLNSIERIEVLPATASGIYGGSATGGVVNVVLRRDYSGLETTVGYENSFQGGGILRRVYLGGGVSINGGKTSLSFNGSYTERDPLRVAQREFYQEYVNRIDANQQAYGSNQYLNGGRAPLGSTTNISARPRLDSACVARTGSAEGCLVAPNLTFKPQYGGASLGAPITSVSENCSVSRSAECIAGYLQNAGRYNVGLAPTLQPGALNSAMLNDPTTQSAAITLRHAFSPRVEGYLNLSGSKDYGRFSQESFRNTFAIAASAPNNPFQQAINVTVPARISDGSFPEEKTKTSRGLLGLKIGLPFDWNTVVEYSLDRADFLFSSQSSLSSAGQTAVTSGGIDVLVAPPAGSGFDFSPYAQIGGASTPSHGLLQGGSVRLAGPIFNVPGGQIILSTLLEYNKQSFSSFTLYDPTFSLSFSEQSAATKSMYAEAQVPLVSHAMGIPLLKTLNLQLATRIERFENVGGVNISDPLLYDAATRPRTSFHSSDPTFGMELQPFDIVRFRASYGTGFFPPGLSQLAPTSPETRPFSFVADPKRGGEPLGDVLYRTGGSPNLRPEQSKTTSFGVVLTPSVPELRLSFDWTKITKRDNISSISLVPRTLSQEDVLPAGVIVRSADPSDLDGFDVGPIVEFNAGLINATRAYSESYDIGVDYLFRSQNIGTFDLRARGTRLVHNQRQLVPAGPTDEYASLRESPSWQANAALSWDWKSFIVSWSTRYLDSTWATFDHAFVPTQASDRIAGATYHDVSVKYDFGGLSALPNLLSGGSVQFGVRNVFNKEPRFDAASGIVYDPWGSPMMASYFLSLTARF